MSIETGQQFSLWAIRLAVVCWFAFGLIAMPRRSKCFSDSKASDVGNWQVSRWLWTAASILLAVHLISAFAFFHEWSHLLAANHTAERTEEFTGLYWAGGIWLNYFFVLLCLVESCFWWLAPDRILRRSLFANRLVYGFLVFMTFNAGVLFVSGVARWINLIGFLILGWQAVRRLLSS